jgi:hypothetical protein
MDNCVLSDYTELCGVRLDDLELDSAHATPDEEGITPADWSICYDAVMFRCNFDRTSDDAYLRGNKA